MRSENTIIIFIAASLLLHATLFIQATQQDIILPSEIGNIMSITITKNKIIKKSKYKQVTKPSENLIENKLAEIKPTKKIPENQLAQTTSKTTTTSESLKPSNSSSKTKIISILRDKVQQHFYYPKLAQRRNWQGKVQLAFDVNTHGTIENITVKQTSGYDILDNAAMSALNKVSTIPDYWIKNKYFSDLNLKILTYSSYNI